MGFFDFSLSKALKIPENRFTDDEGLFVSGPLGPRVQVEAFTSKDRFFEEFPDSPLTVLTAEGRRELSQIEGTDWLGPAFRDEEGNLDPEAEDRGFFGSLAHDASSSVGGAVSGAAGGAFEGAFEGLFKDLKGFFVLLILGLIALAVLTPLGAWLAKEAASRA